MSTHEHGQSFQCRVTSEAVTKPKSSTPIKLEEVENIDTSQLESLEPKHKILIQRFFHQPIKDIVEQKLEYIVATSDEEITKHVFGGLFKNKYYPYEPENYCRKHDPNLFEHKNETLLRLGDKFDSLETFRLYIDSNAKQWKYYLKCANSHRGNGKPNFEFKCVFATQHTRHYNAKGLRKRTSKLPKSNCPCRITLKPVPETADTLTVIYVCNHHDHPLTDTYFAALQHGRRIHPSVKEELMDLLSLDVDRDIVKKYFETLTGYKMSSVYFANVLKWMKKNNIERQFSLEKLREMSRKIERIKEELGIADKNDEEGTIDNDFNLQDKASQIQEAINVLRSVSKLPPKPKLPRTDSQSKKRPKITSKPSEEDSNIASPVTNKSRLETRLQELTYDHETLQSIKHLQDSVRGETDSGNWSSVQHEMEPWNRSMSVNKKKRNKNFQKHNPVVETKFESEPNLELEPQTIVIENAQNIDGYAENQEIFYENEITVLETPAEDCNEIIVYENHNENNVTEIVDTENEVSYCIKYEDETTGEVTEQQYILIENLENLPEVHIQATDLATINIVSQNNDSKIETADNQTETKTECFDNNPDVSNGSENDAALAGSEEGQLVNDTSENMKVLGSTDTSFGFEADTVFEVINTDDKKIFPSREVVRSVILNKPSLPKKCIKNTDEIDKTNGSAEPNAKVDRSSIREKRLEILNRHLKGLLKEDDLKRLADDEYYMVVVNDELEETATEDHSFISSDGNTKTEQSTEELPESRTSDKLISYGDIERSAVHCVNKKVQCSLASAADIEKEVKTISRLKRIRESLERDVKRLVATKDGLVKEIMKAKRIKHRI